MGDFSAGAAAFSGFGFIRRSPKTILSWAVGYVLILLVFFALIAAVAGGPLIAAARSGADFEKNPAALLALLPGMIGILAVILVLGIVVAGVVYGAVYRAYMRPQEGGFGYFRLGAAELRLVGVYLLFEVLYVAAVFGGQFLSILAKAAGPGGGMIGGLVQLAIFIVWVVVAVRLSLTMPATFDLGRIAFADSWRLTKGKVWKLIGTYLLTAVAVIALFIILALVVGGVMTAAMAAGQGAGGSTTAALMMAIPIGLVVLLIYPVIIAATLAVVVGPTVAAYRALTVPTVAADVFN